MAGKDPTTAPTTRQKALRINVDAQKHGTFAEIGAGQEVARWFFLVGGAAGTVAKTISAYDMTVSDAIYGPSDRYVSRQRLETMLDYEYDLLLQRLDEKRGSTTTFFAFADTMATRSYARHEDGHGWMGIRFQHAPRAKPSEIIIHVRMLDTENVREQEAIGILGVNLIHGAFYLHEDPNALVGSLRDDLTPERIEVDMVKLTGPCFEGVDNRLMSLQLVEQGFTDAAMFTADGEVVQPAEVLHKKPVLVVRGTFRPVTNPVLKMLASATAQVREELGRGAGEPVVVMEMSLRNLLEGDRVEHSDFLARVDLLGALGKTVMISRSAHDYAMVTHLRRYTNESIYLPMGIPRLRALFQDEYYSDLPGGILESVGKLFCGPVKLLVYPFEDPATRAVVSADTLQVPPHLRYLYAYLLENRLIEPIRDVEVSELHILPQDALAGIRRGDPAWETMLPAKVVRIIKARALFGWRR